MIDFLEWAGSLSGLLGAFLLATHTRVSRYGWLAFLAANVTMIGFALGIGRYGLLVQQLGFMATSLLGIYRAGFAFRFITAAFLTCSGAWLSWLRGTPSSVPYGHTMTSR